MHVATARNKSVKKSPLPMEVDDGLLTDETDTVDVVAADEDADSAVAMDDAAPGIKVSLFDRLEQLRPGLRDKILAYSLRGNRKMGIPPTPESLQDDVKQEICLAWSKIRANLTFGEGKTASFAHRIAWQTGLKVWRELGSAAKLPGNAFRKRADGSTYVDIGAIATPLSLHADTPEDRDWIDSMIELSDAGETEEDESEFRLEQARKQKLGKLGKKLTAMQMRAVLFLLEGKEMLEIGGALGLTKVEINGLFRQIRVAVGSDLAALL